MKPVAAAVAGALISGVAMYTVGAKTTDVDAFASPALVETIDGQYAPASYTTALRPAAAPVESVQVSQPARRQAAPRRTVIRQSAPVQQRVVREERVVVEEEDSNERSWRKTAMIIGGSSAAGAAVGGIVDGKKGALIGAAIGGGAASIYEATKRR